MLRQKEEQLESIQKYIQTHQEDFYRLAFSYTKNSEDALDVVQESVYKVILNANKLKNSEYLKTWIYRIIVNESINFFRKKKSFVTDEKILENISYEDKDIFEFLPLYNAIQELDPKLRTVIILRYYEDMKLEEIASITKSKLSTVKTRLYKSLKLLKEIIGSDMID